MLHYFFTVPVRAIIPKVKFRREIHAHLMNHLVYLHSSVTVAAHRVQVRVHHDKTSLPVMDVPKIIHLHNLAHYQPLNPILARHSISLDFIAYENGLTYPGADLHCERCGVYLIPGLTCSFRIAYKKINTRRPSPGASLHQKQPARSRIFQSTCLVCQFTKKSDALLNERVNKHVLLPPAAGTGETKKKRKNQNRSELSMLLAAKKSQAQQSASKSLSLLEFLQS